MDLKAKMIVDSIRWSLERQGIPVYIEHKGDSNAGAIFIAHDKGLGLYDVYHRVFDYLKGKRILKFFEFRFYFLAIIYETKFYSSFLHYIYERDLYLKI